MNNKRIDEWCINVMVLLLHSLFLCLILGDEWNWIIYFTNWVFLATIIAFFRWRGRKEGRERKDPFEVELNDDEIVDMLERCDEQNE